VDRIDVSLRLLRSLSRARLAGDEVRAGELAVKLLAWDIAHGYDPAAFDRRLAKLAEYNRTARDKRRSAQGRVMQAGEGARNA
jgi:hypothetical protein